jgi:hypothetical protein
MRRLAQALIVPGFIISFSTLVLGQDTIVVKPGDEVRIASAPGRSSIASVVRIERDSIFLKKCAQCFTYSVSQASAPDVEVRQRQPGGHAILGLGVGFLAGGLTGAFILAPCPHGNSGADGPPCGLGQINATLYMASAGLFVGAIVGRLIPSRHWVPARWP